MMKYAIKIKKLRLITYLLLISLIIAIPHQVFAAPGDETTSGQLSLDSTIENISVIFSFSGDNNGNNQAYLYYRQTGAGAWKAGITMTADRRSTVQVYKSGAVTNPYYNQWRAVIFNLSPNTSYEVKVDYVDSDGGSGSVQGSIYTRNDNPSSSGNTYYVSKSGNDSTGNGSQGSPWLTVQKAANSVSPGDTVRIMPGTYNEQVAISSSGTANNYITFTSDNPSTMAVITTNQDRGVFQLNDTDYIRIKSLILRGTSGNADSGVRINGDSVGNIVEGCTISSTGGDWWAGGVILNGQNDPTGPSYTLIQNNNISTSADGNNGPFGVLLAYTGGGTVIRNNNFSGRFYDGIGGGPNFGIGGGPFFNSYIYNNTIEASNDDGIEAEGGGINCAIWNNYITGIDVMGLAIAPCIVGPMYVFRNVIHGEGVGQAAFKLGSDSYGYMYVYHNTFYQVRNSGFATYGSNAVIGNTVFRNNIMESVGGSQYCVEESSSGIGAMDFDYNSMYSPRSICIKWLGIQMTWQDWRDNYGQEPNGIFGAENFVNAAAGNFQLLSGSPGIDRGVILPGFNDPNSPWPYSGSGPDMGAFESSGSPAVDTSPPYTSGHSPARGSSSVPTDVNIVVHVRDNGTGVDQSSIVMRVEGSIVTPSITGSMYDYTVTYNPPSDFSYDQVVDVSINAQDRASTPNVMPQDSYSFTIQSEGSSTNNPPVPEENPDTNSVPVADAGTDRTINSLTRIMLNGSASYDPDGDPITYQWEQISGPTVSLSKNTLMKPKFVPVEDGIYVFSLVVSDGTSFSVADTVSIEVDSASSESPDDTDDNNGKAIGRLKKLYGY